MSDYEAGDWTTPSLTVEPYDATTAATLATTCQATGVTTTLATSSSDGGHTWTGQAYQFTSAGEWVEEWTVINTGSGKERRVLMVEAAPDTGTTGHATTADLAKAVTPLPTDARLLLIRASRDVDQALIAAVYDPADAAVRATLRDATVEQVCGMLAAGDTRGIGASPPQSFTLGSLSVQRGNTGGAPDKVGTLYQQAWQVLQQAGLTGHEPGDYAQAVWV